MDEFLDSLKPAYLIFSRQDWRVFVNKLRITLRQQREEILDLRRKVATFTKLKEMLNDRSYKP